jgi:hypothetical protein
MVIEVGQVRPAVLRGLRLLAETAVVPTLILYTCVGTIGTIPGLGAVLAWCALSVAVRWVRCRRLPGTLLLVVAMLVGRTCVALAFSSVYVFLLQPVLGSLVMAVLFLGSVALGRPITIRLAQDFVSLPTKLVHEPRVRRAFAQISLIWGVSRLLDAGLGLGSIRYGLDAGLLSRGVLSTLLTVASIAVCAAWGWIRLQQIPDVVVSLRG